MGFHDPNSRKQCEGCTAKLTRGQKKFCSRDCYYDFCRRRSAAVALDGYQVCSKCFQRKPFGEFDTNKSSRTGYRPDCKDCRKRYVRGKKVEDPDLYRRKHLKSIYGITLEEYYDILAAQGGGCAVCGKPENNDGKSLAVDHSHKTKIIRGLLCSWCNLRLISKHEDPEKLRNAATYLETPPAVMVLGERKVPTKLRPRKSRTRKRKR